ncbi:MAG: hypothetical protein ABIG87_01130 [Patescibacteria group bacterium]
MRRGGGGEMEKTEKRDRKFESLLREATGDPNLWVPGVGNGGIEGVLDALNSLDDTDIIRIVRGGDKAKSTEAVDLEKELSRIREGIESQEAGCGSAYDILYYAYANAYGEVCHLARKIKKEGCK